MLEAISGGRAILFHWAPKSDFFKSSWSHTQVTRVDFYTVSERAHSEVSNTRTIVNYLSKWKDEHYFKIKMFNKNKPYFMASTRDHAATDDLQ